ncbi:Glycine cleavage system H protein [Vigna angularis]|uniref:Glycine cleavage system H protein n=1 Tax=Phaseolus angularis TaxID=3914 RepID=A0A8T0JIU6_PHAAN|nr:Glycine cleavage system H protein [Vigna angularis]
MALRMWASSTANALKLSSASRPHLLPPFSFSRCLSTGIYTSFSAFISLSKYHLHTLFASFTVLDGLKYAESHEWVKHEGSVATIGITDHAQGHLGEVVFVELPEAGVTVSKSSGFGAVESVKASSDINSPISGEVVEVNKKLTETPGLVNSSPYEDGWMIKVKPSDPSELESLLGPKEYTKFCEEEDASH